MSLPPSSPWSAYSSDDLLPPMSGPTPSFLDVDLDVFLSQPRSASQSRTGSSRTTRSPLQRRQDELKAQLRDATTLMSHFYVEATGQTSLEPIVWPQSKSGRAVSLSGLRKYAAEHQFLENITCFCSLLSGTSTPVKLFTVHKRDSEHRGDQCLGCKYWDQGKEDLGCKYFVNITRLFENHPPQDTFPYPETPANTKAEQKRMQAAQRRADRHPLSSHSQWQPAPKLPAMRKVAPAVHSGQTVNPYIENGSVGSVARLHQPAPTEYVSRKVQDVVPPTSETTLAMFDGLLRHGIPMPEFLRLVAVCTQCKHLVALCGFPEHPCIRPLVQRRSDGSWVSRTPSTAVPRPFPMSSQDLEDVFNSKTPPSSNPLQLGPQPSFSSSLSLTPTSSTPAFSHVASRTSPTTPLHVSTPPTSPTPLPRVFSGEHWDFETATDTSACRDFVKPPTVVGEGFSIIAATARPAKLPQLFAKRAMSFISGG